MVVGADRIAANGDTANKIGTYTVAVLAQRHGVPFYVAAPLSTIDPETPSGREIPIEQRAGGEVKPLVDWAPVAGVRPHGGKDAEKHALSQRGRAFKALMEALRSTPP